MIEQDIQKIGLSEKEAKVYLASLRLGKSPVQEIASQANVNRGTAYNIIESLTSKGLMSSYQEGKKQYFFAESPEKLELLFKQQQEEIEKNRKALQELLPELKKMDNKDKSKPVVRYFEGKNGIRAMVEDMFKVERGTEIIMVYPNDDIEKNFSREELDYWKDKRIKKGINIKAIYTKNNAVYIGERAKFVEKKISIDLFNIKSDIAIYEDRVRIASFGNMPIGIIIEDKDMADTLRSMFRLAWNSER